MVATPSSSRSSDTRKSVTTPSSESSISRISSEGGSKVIEIASRGDILLQIEHETKTGSTAHTFQADSAVLKNNSKYFERLLQSGRFGEGIDVEAKYKTIREQYGNIADAPLSALPTVEIKDIGRISAIKAIDVLLTDFLSILHGKDTQALPPVANLANLAIVADRFDALQVVKNYVKRKKIIRVLDGKTTPKIDTSLTEEKVRQRLLVAILLDYPPWLDKYSARLIVKGWVGKEPDTAAALWWDLPSRVEEELAYRRECVLETIQSVQSHFLSLYTSRERQCKLGYDNSTQCDSFQLGEMIRFFTRVGTLKLQGTLCFTDEDDSTPYTGDLYMLIDSLRQVPEYQIDKFHSHCGIRTRITPLLDTLQVFLLQVGICPECWQEARREYAWIDSKRPLLWKRIDHHLESRGHAARHADIKAVFTANEKQWS